MMRIKYCYDFEGLSCMLNEFPMQCRRVDALKALYWAGLW